MDNANTLVTIFGGSGFVGTQLVQALALASGWRHAQLRHDAGQLRPA